MLFETSVIRLVFFTSFSYNNCCTSFFVKVANLCEDSTMAATGFAQSLLGKNQPDSKPLSVGSRHSLTDNCRQAINQNQIEVEYKCIINSIDIIISIYIITTMLLDFGGIIFIQAGRPSKSKYILCGQSEFSSLISQSELMHSRPTIHLLQENKIPLPVQHLGIFMANHFE